MLILKILANIVFWYSIGSIFALVIAYDAAKDEEYYEVDGLLHFDVDEEEIDLNEYYRVAGLCSWGIVLQWINKILRNDD